MSSEIDQPRQSWKGVSQITIRSDENGALSVQSGGNLTLAELIAGMELLKAELVKKATSLGVMRTPKLDLNPRHMP